MTKFNLGICSVSFRTMDPAEIIKAVSEVGLSCIEWGSDVHVKCNDKVAADEINRLQKEYGITTASYGTYFYLGKNTLEELKEYIKTAKMIGADILRLWCGEKSSSSFSPEEKAEFFAECKMAAKIAEAENVVLGMECHGGTFCDEPDSCVELMEAVNSKHFRMYWQPDTIGVTAPNIESARKLSEYAVNIHVHYWVDSKHQPLGDGVEPWRSYVSEFTPGKCLLLEFMPDGRIETLPKQAEALKAIAL